MKKNKFLVVFLSFIGVLVFVVSSLMLNKHFTSNTSGIIKVELINLEGIITKTKDINFKSNDTLPILLENNFDNIVIENGMLMSIDEFTTPSDWYSFIVIYVDNKMSEVGILDIEFKDGTLISFIMSEFTYNQ